MPLALLAIGMLAVITAIKGNQAEVMSQFEKDLTGSGSFIYWIAAIVVLAIFGRVAGLSDTAKMFIALILVVYVVAQNGLWAQASNALAGLNASAAGAVTPQQPTGATAAAAAIPVPNLSTMPPATATVQ